jgi:hypothetical protein
MPSYTHGRGFAAKNGSIMENAEVASISRNFAPIRRLFIEKNRSEKSPLASLLSGTNAAGGGGGRGGRLRVLLLISLIWVIAREPYNTGRTAPFWARLLDLEDPTGAGARAIRDTLHELRDRGFVRLNHVPGGGMTIDLLMETGSGSAYTPPEPPEQQYFRVPRSFWTSGTAMRLSGRALAMYLIALGSGSDGRSFWLNQAAVSERNGLSDTTRKKGLRELVEAGVLDVTGATGSQSGATGERTFVRNVYTIKRQFRVGGPAEETRPDPDLFGGRGLGAETTMREVMDWLNARNYTARPQTAETSAQQKRE